MQKEFRTSDSQERNIVPTCLIKGSLLKNTKTELPDLKPPHLNKQNTQRKVATEKKNNTHW